MVSPDLPRDGGIRTMVDLVGIEPTTSPATPGRALPPSKRRSILESNDGISNSSVVARALEPQTRFEMVPCKPAAMVRDREWTWFAHGCARPGALVGLRYTRCRIGPNFHSAGCIRQALGEWWTWSGSNRRPLPCHGSALPAAPQAHCYSTHRVGKIACNRFHSPPALNDSQT